MHFGLVLASVFFFTTWIHLVHAFIGPMKGCECLRWSDTQVEISRIKSYAVQEETKCSVRVIKFRTVLGKTICSNPNNNWTKNAMKKLDLQKRVVVERQKTKLGSKIAPTKSALTHMPSTQKSGVGTMAVSVSATMHLLSTLRPKAHKMMSSAFSLTPATFPLTPVTATQTFFDTVLSPRAFALTSSTSASGTTVSVSGGSSSAPGASPSAPGASPSAPGVSPSAPGVSPSAPGVSPSAPGVSPSAPGVPLSAPASSTTSTTPSTSAPTSFTPKLAVFTPTPTQSASRNVISTMTPKTSENMSAACKLEPAAGSPGPGPATASSTGTPA